MTYNSYKEGVSNTNNNSSVQINIVNKRLRIDYQPYSQSITGLRITDICEKIVYSTIFEQVQSSANIDLSTMNKRYYVIILKSNTDTINRNIIVE